MRTDKEEVKAAAGRVVYALQRYPIALLLPLVCSSLIVRLFTSGFHKAFGRKHHAVELLLYLAVDFPVGAFAGLVLARMFACARGGQRPSLAEAGEMARARGLAATIFRLALRLLLWGTLVFAATGVLLMLGAGVAHFAFAAAHHGARLRLPHRWSRPYIFVSSLLLAVLLSRYSFVLPLFAGDAGGTRESFKRSVGLARGRLSTLSLFNAGEYALVLGAGHALQHFEKGRSLRAVIVTGFSLLVTAGVWTCFELLKAELAFVAREKVCSKLLDLQP